MKKITFSVDDIASAMCFIDNPSWSSWRDEWRDEFKAEFDSKLHYEFARRRYNQVSHFLVNEQIKNLGYKMCDTENTTNTVRFVNEISLIWLYKKSARRIYFDELLDKNFDL